VHYNVGRVMKMRGMGFLGGAIATLLTPGCDLLPKEIGRELGPAGSSTGETPAISAASTGGPTKETGTEGGAAEETTGGEEACEIAEYPVIEGKFNGLCPSKDFVISTKDEWETFANRCNFGGLDDTIDFDTHRVLGAVSFYSECSLAPGQKLGTMRCGSELRVFRWAYSNMCFCDNFGIKLDLHVVPNDEINLATHDWQEEATCDQVTCECNGEAVSACDAHLGCPKILDVGPFDGEPPPWPTPAIPDD
jgi:hypothetical protein